MPEWTGSFDGQGLYGDLPEDEYHRDAVPGGSLSHSGCPGYCDDHQTYNLRPAETGGAPDA